MFPKRCRLIRKLALSQVATWESLVLVLFPLDGADGLGGQVHEDAVDALDLDQQCISEFNSAQSNSMLTLSACK